MTARFMIYPSAAQADAVLTVVDARLSLPRRDRPTGPPTASPRQQARGWTTAECSRHEANDGSGEVAIGLTDAAYALSGRPGPPMLDFSAYLTALPPKFWGA